VHHADPHVEQAALVRMVCLGSRASECLGRGSGAQSAIERVAIVETPSRRLKCGVQEARNLLNLRTGSIFFAAYLEKPRMGVL